MTNLFVTLYSNNNNVSFNPLFSNEIHNYSNRKLLYSLYNEINIFTDEQLHSRYINIKLRTRTKIVFFLTRNKAITAAEDEQFQCRFLK